MSTVSYFSRAKEVIPSHEFSVDQFLDDVEHGTWFDYVADVRMCKDKTTREEAKKLTPMLTLSGKFSYRSIDKMEKHSGFIAIDVDSVDDLEHLKSLVYSDPHVYAGFESISGTGLCLLFKIDGRRHLDAFEAIEVHIMNQYGEAVDKTCKDVTRTRFVSHDPRLYRNPDAKKWDTYLDKPPKERIEFEKRQIVYAEGDFFALLDKLQDAKVDIVTSYHDWFRVGGALADKFGETGRGYFHAISQFGDYDGKKCDKQYSACMKAKGTKRANMATIYFLAKQKGILAVSPETNKIISIAKAARKTGRSPQAVVDELEKMEYVSPAVSREIVEQVFAGADSAEPESMRSQINEWLRQNYDLWFNIVRRTYENRGKGLDNRALKSLRASIKEAFEDAEWTLIDTILESEDIRGYDPFARFVAKYEGASQPGAIDALFDTIEGPLPKDYVRYFGKKWFVGMVACALGGEPGQTMLILCGRGGGTGKSWFFKKLLPPELMDYFGEKSLGDINNASDKNALLIIMSKKVLILDDEMSGKSKRDEKKIKALISTDGEDIRPAFGRLEEVFKRLATFGGTSNDLGVLGWDVSQRRMIVLEVDRRDKAGYDAISKIGAFMEAVDLYRAGFDYRVLGDDIPYLNSMQEAYAAPNMEEDLVLAAFKAGKWGENGYCELTTGEILQQLGARVTLSATKIGIILGDAGVQKKAIRRGAKTVMVYCLCRLQ